MLTLLIFSFVSGLLTILAPCIWPLLPIILSSTTKQGKNRPLGIVLGIVLSFTIFTLTISYIVKLIPFDPNSLRLFAVVVIGVLGLTFLIPKLSSIIEGAVSKLIARFGGKLLQSGQNSGFGSAFVTGVALGLVWSPCAGPILASIATLAATRAVNFQVILVTLVYTLGVGIPLFIFALVGNKLFTRTRFLSSKLGVIQQIFGVIMILTAIAIYTNYDKTLQVKLLDAFPSFTEFLIGIEETDSVQEELDKLQGGKDMPKDVDMGNIIIPKTNKTQPERLPNYGKAPEIIGITNWLNSQPLTPADLKGKVVLIDFWTYTCINCIRTLPHVTGWYEKYKDDGFVVIGVHSPEFEFEKKTENVQNAIKQYSINYPVAQDNDFKTWRNYNNRYWPAKYLIDSEGNLRYSHFGEGKYEETEMAIQELLRERGDFVGAELEDMQDKTPAGVQTPETYLGLARMENFASPETPAEGPKDYSLPSNLQINQFAYGGIWDLSDESATSFQDSVLEINFIANIVNLVVTPTGPADEILVYLDGELISNEDAGADVKDGRVILDTERLYELVNLEERATGRRLRIEFKSQGVSIFAFTFG